MGESEAGDLEQGAIQWPVLQAETALLTDSSEAGAPAAATTGKMLSNLWKTRVDGIIFFLYFIFHVITES